MYDQLKVRHDAEKMEQDILESADRESASVSSKGIAGYGKSRKYQKLFIQW